MEYFHSILRPFYTKLVRVPGFWEPGTRLGSPFLGTRNPPGFPVPGNPGTRTNFVQKAVKDYESILLCLRNAEKWIVKRVPGSRERNPDTPIKNPLEGLDDFEDHIFEF
jgi:hypothetical protein